MALKEVLSGDGSAFKTILENTISGTLILKPVYDENRHVADFELLYVSQPAEDLLYEQDLTGKRLKSGLPVLANSGLFGILIQVMEKGDTWEDEISYHHDKVKLRFMMKAVKLDENCLITFHDITNLVLKDTSQPGPYDNLQQKAIQLYQALYYSSGQGLCTIKLKLNEKGVPVDYQFLDVNPSFELHTGIKDATGRWIRDIAPDHDEFWFSIYGSVAVNRKAEKFEYFSTPLKRWWGVYAFPVDDPELLHVGVLFSDITSRKRAEEEKEELFRSIAYEKMVLSATLVSLPLAVWIADKEGKITQSNEQTKTIWGEGGEYAGDITDYGRFRGWRTDTGERLKPKDWAMARAIQKGETILQEEIEIERFNGESAFILNNAAPIRNEKGEIIGGITIAQNITHMKKMELELKRTEARKEYLLKLSDALHFLEDPVQIQFEAVRILGEHMGAHRAGYAEDMGNGELVKVTRNYTRDVQGLEGIYSYADYGEDLLAELIKGNTVIRNDIDKLSSLSPRQKKEHKVLGIGASVNKPLIKNNRLKAILFVHFSEKHDWTEEEIALIDDTAERTWAALEWARAEEALKKSEDKYRIQLEKEVKKRTLELMENKHFTQLITDSTPDVLFVYDINKWKIVYVNKGINTTLGYNPEDVYAADRKSFEKMIHPDDLKRRIIEMAKMVHLEPGEVRESVFRIKDSSGNLHWFDVRDLSFKTGKNGKTVQALSICRDVTEKMEAINAYRNEKNRSEELRRMNELMDTFVFAAAHDLKAPVSNLKMITQIIETTREKEKKLLMQTKYKEVINTLDMTISGLVNIISIEKDLSSGIKTLFFKKVLDKVLAEFGEEIKKISPKISYDFSECKSVSYVESFLYSIFRNMLSNSFNFKSDDRQLVIHIKSGFEKNFVWLSFSDNGTGINLPLYGKELFKPFKRFSSNVKSSGLGLYLVRSIVTKNGGKIEVESNVNEGSLFTIFMLPYNN